MRGEDRSGEDSRRFRRREENDGTQGRLCQRVVEARAVFAPTKRRGKSRRREEVRRSEESVGEVFEHRERERRGAKDAQNSRGKIERGKGEEERRERSRNSNTTSGNGPGIVSRVGDFLGAVRYQYSYGLSDNGRIAANCVVAAFLFSSSADGLV